MRVRLRGFVGATVCLAGVSASAQTVRDSAGIRIFTYPEPARANAVWHLDPKPLLEIGGASGTGPTEFTHIWGAARTASGGLVISDEPAQELRVFDANGRHLRTMGRKGEGPGEFSQIRGVFIYGDTVYALDDTRGTAVFLLDGRLIRQAVFPSLAPYHPVDPWGAMADGSTIETAAGRETLQMVMQVGTRIEMRGLFRVARDSRSATLLATLPSYEHYRAHDDPLGGGELVAFAPVLTVAVFANRVCTARGERFEIRCMNGAGQFEMIVRRDMPLTPVSATAREEYRARIRGSGKAPGEGFAIPQSRLDELAMRTHFAESFPALGWIAAGKDGEIWVSDYRYQQFTRAPGSQARAGEVTHWNVFARDGVWSGAVDMPAGFTLKEAGRDYVLGVNRDEDGVERVTVYKLIR